MHFRHVFVESRNTVRPVYMDPGFFWVNHEGICEFTKDTVHRWPHDAYVGRFPPDAQGFHVTIGNVRHIVLFPREARRTAMEMLVGTDDTEVVVVVEPYDYRTGKAQSHLVGEGDVACAAMAVGTAIIQGTLDDLETYEVRIGVAAFRVRSVFDAKQKIWLAEAAPLPQ